MLSEIEVNFFGGKSENHASDYSKYSRHCYIPYMGISGCRPRVTKSRPFLIPSSVLRCRISVFEILLQGGVKLVSLTIIWEEICIYFSHLRQNLEVSALFLSRYCWFVLWNFIPLKCRRHSLQIRLGLKKIFFERVFDIKQLPACSLSLLSRLS